MLMKDDLIYGYTVPLRVPVTFPGYCMFIFQCQGGGIHFNKRLTRVKSKTKYSVFPYTLLTLTGCIRRRESEYVVSLQ